VNDLDGFVQPAYQQRSLADVIPAVAEALGCSIGKAPARLVLPEAVSYVVFLVDGLGAEQLRRHGHAAPYLSSLLVDQEVATAGVPSTTVTSLTSLGTGLPPGAHGLVGFTSRIPGTDQLLNALHWNKSVDPTEWQPHPTAFARLAGAGVSVTSVNKREFRASGLTVASQRGAEFVGADRVGERIAAVAAASTARPSLTYMYDGDLDWTGHRFGVASSQWLQQLAMVDAEAEQLRETLPASTRLVVVADHGMLDSPPDRRVDVDEFLELREGDPGRRGGTVPAPLLPRWRGRRRGGDLALDARRPGRGAHPRRGGRPRLVRGGATSRTPPDRRRRGRLPRRPRDRLHRRLRLRGHAGGVARVAHGRGDADTAPGVLTGRSAEGLVTRTEGAPEPG
jgi:hypothetical protein